MKNTINNQFKNRQYAVTKRLDSIGNNTIADLVSWLETFVNIIFPNNCIYYWNALEKHHKMPASTYFICTDPIPKYVSTLEGPHHSVCYVRDGSNEGYMIEVAYMMRDNTYRSVCNGKYLGSETDAWNVARIISRVLNDAIGCNEWPMVVDMYQRVPRKYPFDRKSNLLESVNIITTTHSIKVVTQSGSVFEHIELHESDDNAAWTIECHKHDWLKVLVSLGINVELDTWFVHSDARLMSLDGFIITTRAHAGTFEEGNEIGWYVQLPSANPRLENSYLGKFEDIDTAIAAAKSHHDGQKLSLAA